MQVRIIEFHVAFKDIQDSWIESIDWVAVKERQTDIKENQNDVQEDSDDEPAEVNVLESYKQMLAIMRPGESVIAALKRLGGKGKGKGKEKPMSFTEKLKARKLAKQQQAENGGTEKSEGTGDATTSTAGMFTTCGQAALLLTVILVLCQPTFIGVYALITIY
jgi:hypothetical protein